MLLNHMNETIGRIYGQRSAKQAVAVHHLYFWLVPDVHGRGAAKDDRPPSCRLPPDHLTCAPRCRVLDFVMQLLHPASCMVKEAGRPRTVVEISDRPGANRKLNSQDFHKALLAVAIEVVNALVRARRCGMRAAACAWTPC